MEGREHFSYLDKSSYFETVSQFACELEKQFIRLDIQENYYKLLIFLRWSTSTFTV